MELALILLQTSLADWLHFAKYAIPSTAGVITIILLMKENGKRVSIYLGALMVVSGCACAYLVGDYLDFLRLPNAVVHASTYLSGMVGHTIVGFVHTRFAKPNIAETLKSIAEWLLRK